MSSFNYNIVFLSLCIYQSNHAQYCTVNSMPGTYTIFVVYQLRYHHLPLMMVLKRYSRHRMCPIKMSLHFLIALIRVCLSSSTSIFVTVHPVYSQHPSTAQHLKCFEPFIPLGDIVPLIHSHKCYGPCKFFIICVSYCWYIFKCEEYISFVKNKVIIGVSQYFLRTSRYV